MSDKVYIVTFRIKLESTSPEAAIEIAHDVLHGMLSDGDMIANVTAEQVE